MKLVHPDLENQILFLENKVNVVTIENKQFFSSFIQELGRQCSGDEGNFVLVDTDVELDIAKSCVLIIDPFSIDINNKSILNKVLTQLKMLAVTEEHYMETNNIKSNIYAYLDSLLFDCDVPLIYQDDFDFSALFKMMNIRFENSGITLLENILDYLAVSIELLSIRCFFFVNLKQFLSYEELDRLYTFAHYAKIDMILFEGCFMGSKHSCETHYIIDNDLCEIY